MKGLTNQLKNQSIEKWENIIVFLQRKAVLNYKTLIWGSYCGFCRASGINIPDDRCSTCLLYKNKICWQEWFDENRSVYKLPVHLTIEYAEKEQFEKALVQAEKVLKAIKNARIDKNA